MIPQTADPVSAPHPKARACRCGKVPLLSSGRHRLCYLLQIVCECGEKTAVLMYTKPLDRELMIQVAVDSWNIGNPPPKPTKD